MWGLSFIHSGFVVAGVVAAGLPIVIHLLMKQRSRPLPIGSVRFLKSVLRQHTRRRRIRQWLLLALRTLVVLLLALLFARPFFSQSDRVGLDRQVLLLLDRSASMQATGDGSGTLFDAGLKIAREELSQLDEQTAVQLALFDASGVEAIELERFDRSLEPSDAATDYGAALAWARDLVVASPRPDQHVILITDLQQSGWERTPIDDFPPHAQLTIRDVGRAISQNVAVIDCAAVHTEIRPKEPVRVAVRLSNGGALPARDVALRLKLQGPRGVVEARKSVTLPGGADRTVEFALEQVAVDGMYEGNVSIEREDDLMVDNRRWLAFEARHPDRLLLVDGQQGRSVYGNETYYLETALRLRLPASAGPTRSFEIERIVWEDGDGFPGLEGFRAIVLCNVGRLSEVDGRRLGQYVNGGGNLLVFAGDQTTPVVVQRLRDAGLFAGQVARDPAQGKFRCRNWDRSHPIFTPFDDPQRGDLRRLVFERMLNVTELDAEVRVLIEAGPYPWILEQAAGKGTVMLVTTPADRAWSDWPQNRLYVPLVRQLLAYLTDQLGERRPVRSQLVEGERRKAGIARQGDTRVVYNIDPRESRLDRLAEEDVRGRLGLEDVSAEQQAAGLTLPETRSRPSEFWNWLMWGLLLVLVLETLLASRVHA